MVARGEYFLSYLKPSQGTAYRSKQPSWLTSDLLSSYDGFWVVSKKAPHAEALLKELAGSKGFTLICSIIWAFSYLDVITQTTIPFFRIDRFS